MGSLEVEGGDGGGHQEGGGSHEEGGGGEGQMSTPRSRPRRRRHWRRGVAAELGVRSSAASAGGMRSLREVGNIGQHSHSQQGAHDGAPAREGPLAHRWCETGLRGSLG